MCVPPPGGLYLVGGEAEVAGDDVAVLEAARQVPHQVLVVQPIILIQVLLEGAAGCAEILGGGSVKPPLGKKMGFGGGTPTLPGSNAGFSRSTASRNRVRRRFLPSAGASLFLGGAGGAAGS